MKVLRYSASLVLITSALFVLMGSTAFAATFVWTNDTTGTALSGLPWYRITSSADGTKLAAIDASISTSDLWTSTDGGHTWTNQTTGTGLSGPDWTSII